MKKADAILTGDWHLRDSVPECRTDNFWGAQWGKVHLISELQKEHACPILNSGDLFHKWKASPFLLSECIKRLPFMYCIPGNHDLPSHNLDLLNKAGIQTLEEAGIMQILKTKLGGVFNFSFKDSFDSASIYWNHNKKVGLIHKLINHPQSDTSARSILKEYPDFDLIISGDNHKSFTEKLGNQLLVNPGSLTRQSANHNDDHVPCVYLWYADTNGVEKVILPYDKNAISREHLQSKEKHDERMNAFVKKLSDDYEVDLSFKRNLEQYFEANKTKEAVKELVYESISS